MKRFPRKNNLKLIYVEHTKGEFHCYIQDSYHVGHTLGFEGLKDGRIIEIESGKGNTKTTARDNLIANLTKEKNDFSNEVDELVKFISNNIS
jgi:RecA/RadA recombinase